MKGIARIFVIAVLLNVLPARVHSQTLGEVLRAAQRRQVVQQNAVTANNILFGRETTLPLLIDWGLGTAFPTDDQVNALPASQQISLLRQAWGDEGVIYATLGGPISIENFTRALRLFAASLRKNPGIPWPEVTATSTCTTGTYDADSLPNPPLQFPDSTITSNTNNNEINYAPILTAYVYGSENTDESGDTSYDWNLVAGWFSSAIVCESGSFPGTFQISESNDYMVNGITGLTLPSSTVGDGTPQTLYHPGSYLWQATPLLQGNQKVTVNCPAPFSDITAISYPGSWWPSLLFVSGTAWSFAPALSIQTSTALLQSVSWLARAPSNDNADGLGGVPLSYACTFIPNFGQEFASSATPAPEPMPKLKIVPDFAENKLKVRLANDPANDCQLYWLLESDSTQSLAARHILKVEGYGAYDAVYSGIPTDREPEYLWQGGYGDQNERWPNFGSYLSEWWQPVLTQLKTATWGLNIRQTGGFGYEIDFYRADQIGAKDPTTLRYSFTGDPVETWTVENMSQDASQGGQMRITTSDATYDVTGTGSEEWPNYYATYTILGTDLNTGMVFLNKNVSETSIGSPAAQTPPVTIVDNTTLDGQTLPAITTTYWTSSESSNLIVDQVTNGTETTQYTYDWEIDDSGNLYIDHLTGITRTGGSNPYTATYDDNEMLSEYVSGPWNIQYSDNGSTVTRTENFNGNTVQTLQTSYGNGMTSGTTTANGISDVMASWALYPGTDPVNPWAPQMVSDFNGNLTTYSYGWSGTNFVTTMQTGPAGSTTSGTLTAGTQTVSTVNDSGKVIAWQTADIQSGAVLDFATATQFQSGTPFPSVMQRPLNSKEGYIYEPDGQLMSFTDRLGVTTGFAFDPLERPTEVTKGNSTWNIVYDPNPNFGYDITLSAPGETNQTWDDVFGDPFGETQTITISGPQDITVTRAETADSLTTQVQNTTTSESFNDSINKTTLAETITGNATQPWNITDSVPSAGGWTQTTTHGTDSALTASTTFDPVGRVLQESSPNPGGTGPDVSTAYAYTNGQLTSATDPDGYQTQYSYQPNGSLQTVARGSCWVSVNRASAPGGGQIQWNCTDATGETMWQEIYNPSTDAVTTIPYGQSAQAVTATPQINGSLLSLVTAGPLSGGTTTWQEGGLYQFSYATPGSAVSGSATFGAFGELTSATVNPGAIPANAETVSCSPLGLPSQVSGLVAGSFSDSFPAGGLSETFTSDGHTQTQSYSPDGQWEGVSGYGSPDQSWSLPNYGSTITRTLTTGTGSGATVGPVQFTWSLGGTLLGRQFPDGTSESFGYDADGAMSSWNSPRASFGFLPNEYGQPTQIGSTGSFGYDRAGRLNAILDPAGSCTLSYTNGQLFKESYSSGVLISDTVEHDYNALGLLQTVKLPGNVSVGYTYTSGTLTGVTTAGGANGTWSNYDPVSGCAQNLTLGPLSTSSAFDGLGRNTSQISSAGGTTWAYTGRSYNGDGHCYMVTTPQGTGTYGYDSNGFLHTATIDGTSLTYSFDATGRPAGATDYRPTMRVNKAMVDVLGSVAPGATVTINGTTAAVNGVTGAFSRTYTPTPDTWQTYNVVGSLVGAGSSGTSVAEEMREVFVPPLSESLGYDGSDGNRTSDARWSQSWNSLDQLVTITETNAYSAVEATQISCIYDSAGRRVQKTVSVGGTVTKRTTTLWDGWRPVMETDYNASGAVIATRYYTWGPDVSGNIDGAAGIGGLVEILDKEGNLVTRSLPIYDGIGNVVGLVDGATGLSVATYYYGPFGELLSESGPRADICPFRYQTKLYDCETGYYYFGKRYYDPKSQVWLSRDPIREEGGVTLYAYCNDDPVGNFDPIGESPFDFNAAEAQLAAAIDSGDPAAIAAAEEGMSAPPPAAPSAAMQFIGGLFGPSDADLALSPAQPLGSGLGHQASLYGWSLYNSAARFVSMADDPSRLITGQQSISAQAIDGEYLRRFTYGERSAADANIFVTSLFAPFAAEKLGDVVEGTVGVLRNLNFGNEGAVAGGILRPNLFASEIGSIVTPSAGTVEDGQPLYGGSLFDNGFPNVNPRGGTMNCINCAIATDATLGGNAASALPGIDEYLSVLEEEFGGTFQPVRGSIDIGRILSQSGNGARGIVAGDPMIGDVGHVFNAINDNGTIEFIDGQKGIDGALHFYNLQNFHFLLTFPGTP